MYHNHGDEMDEAVAEGQPDTAQMPPAIQVKPSWVAVLTSHDTLILSQNLS